MMSSVDLLWAAKAAASRRNQGELSYRSARPWWSTHSQGLVLWQKFPLQTALLIAIINPSPVSGAL